ncbi:hypothetical protein MSTE_03611 [Mycobacteroides stephanolepidis]|uniref:Uncharacterized protein n=1 Tax=[Mycobacterium] stephanolepidis TaxID=1520670 RepID=A0A1Z4F118_9MYCO|nr:hypothetical protein [[Mycobacterium] stephanolepidis]BAX98911.1 hypothetical protein MSTE_03611 [[Mycobacterium] stephanolepidis]
MSGEQISRAQARKSLEGPVYKVVSKYMRKGFKLTKGGHLYTIWCPCGGVGGKGWFSVNGTPNDADHHAQQIERFCRKCPKKPH